MAGEITVSDGRRLVSGEFRPNLFVLGAAKCGTTTAYDVLASLPGICMSRPKEPFFFECEYHNGLEYYRKKYFPHWAGEGWVGEARHRNLYLPYVPERIHSTSPAAHLLVVLRDPIERAWSHWWHFYSRGIEALTFEEAVQADLKRIAAGESVDGREMIHRYCSNPDNHRLHLTYVDSGYYAAQISRYLKLYDRSQLHVAFLEELRADPTRRFRDWLRFLGPTLLQSVAPEWSNKRRALEIPHGLHRAARTSGISRMIPGHWRSRIARWYSARRTRRYRMLRSTRDLLTAHYQSHGARLEEVLGRPLPPNWQKPA